MEKGVKSDACALFGEFGNVAGEILYMETMGILFDIRGYSADSCIRDMDFVKLDNLSKVGSNTETITTIYSATLTFLLPKSRSLMLEYPLLL